MLCVERDGVNVASRSGKGRKLELKLAVAYGGKEQIGSRRRLLQRRAFAALAAGVVFWEQATADFGQKWDLGAAGQCVITGDGAGWIKAGQELFPGARYRLDRYHLLRRALVEALVHVETALRRPAGALAAGDWSETADVLQEAERRADSRQQKARIRALRRYLAADRDGIVGSDEAFGLGGAIEGQVFHHVRMKRHGARWSEGGVDHLVRLLGVHANGEVEAVCRGRQRPVPEQLRTWARE